MPFNLTGYCVIVTGASRGIGRGTAKRFAEAGASVSVCARDYDKLAEAAVEIGAVHKAVCDVSDAAAVDAYVNDAAAALGGLDVLVNNASGFGRADNEDGWAAAVGIDLMGTLRASWSALPWLRRSRHGSLVHVTSTSAFKPSVIGPAYSAIKAAIVHYTRSQAKLLAKEGIRVNSVAPGPTTAPGHFYEQRREARDPSFAKLIATMPSGRLGTPEEISDVVLFLASHEGRWINGQTIVADGGQSLFDNM